MPKADDPPSNLPPETLARLKFYLDQRPLRKQNLSFFMAWNGGGPNSYDPEADADESDEDEEKPPDPPFFGW